MAAPRLDQPIRHPASAEARTEAPTEAAKGPGPVEIVHGTAVRWQKRGMLLLGPSGIGKSDLALRLIERGAELVADDLVRLTARNGRLVARAEAGPGLIELRGQGIFRLPAVGETRLDLALELNSAFEQDAERLPAPRRRSFAGCTLPAWRLDPRTASATARIAVLCSRERVY